MKVLKGGGTPASSAYIYNENDKFLFDLVSCFYTSAYQACCTPCLYICNVEM